MKGVIMTGLLCETCVHHRSLSESCPVKMPDKAGDLCVSYYEAMWSKLDRANKQIAHLKAELADYKVGCKSLKDSARDFRDERDQLQAENDHLCDLIDTVRQEQADYLKGTLEGKLQSELDTANKRIVELESGTISIKPYMLLPLCSRSYQVGTVTICGNIKNKLYDKPCSKHCETPENLTGNKGADNDTQTS